MGKKGFIVLGIIVAVSMVVVVWVSSIPNVRYLPKVLQESRQYLAESNYDSAVFLAYQVLKSAKNPNNLSYAEAIIGYSYYKIDSLDLSYLHYKRSLSHVLQADSTDHILKASTLNMLGRIFEKKESHKKAIEYYRSAKDIYEVFESPTVVVTYYNLAYSQSQINDIECVKSYYKALEYATKFKNNKYESMCLNDLGNLMLDTDNFESAVEYFNLSLSSEYTTNSLNYTAYAYQGLGEAYYYIDDFENSEESLTKAVQIKSQLDDQKYLFTANLFLARLHSKKGDDVKSESYYKKSIEYFALTEHSRKNIAVFKELSSVQFKMGKVTESNENNIRHYAEIEIYLDEKERSAELARQDQFDTTVAVQEAQYRNNSKWTLLDNVDWGLWVKLSALICTGLFLFVSERKFQLVRVAFS